MGTTVTSNNLTTVLQLQEHSIDLKVNAGFNITESNSGAFNIFENCRSR